MPVANLFLRGNQNKKKRFIPEEEFNQGFFRGTGFFYPPSFALKFPDLGAGQVDLTPSFAVGVAPSFTRATGATTVGSTGLVVPVSSGIARSYYDPTSLTYLGYLAEGARTNLCLQSEDFATSWTPNTASVSPNAVVAPNGTTTADSLIEDATVGVQHYLQAAGIAGLTSTTNYTASCFFKANTRTKGRIAFIDGLTADGVQATFDLSAGTITSSGVFGLGTLVGSSITSYPNGWYRISVTGAMNNGKTTGTILLNLADAAGAISYNGDGASRFAIWGAQLEEASFVSSYIPTTTVAVARNADVLTYPTTNWFSNIEGSIYLAFMGLFGALTTADVSRVALARNSLTARFAYVPSGGAFTGISNFDGTNTQSGNAIASLNGSLTRHAVAWSGAEKVSSSNGGIVAPAAYDGAWDVSGDLLIGLNSGGNDWFGPISNVIYWPARRPDVYLQYMTNLSSPSPV